MLAMVNTSRVGWLNGCLRLGTGLSIALALGAAQLTAKPLVEPVPPGKQELIDGSPTHQMIRAMPKRIPLSPNSRKRWPMGTPSLRSSKGFWAT